MTQDTIIDLSQQALYIVVMLSAPMLISALTIGLIVGMFQAATQINEMTLSFIPKLFILVIALMTAGPWMLQMLVSYTQNLYLSIPSLIS